MGRSAVSVRQLYLQRQDRQTKQRSLSALSLGSVLPALSLRNVLPTSSLRNDLHILLRLLGRGRSSREQCTPLLQLAAGLRIARVRQGNGQ